MPSFTEEDLLKLKRLIELLPQLEKMVGGGKSVSAPIESPFAASKAAPAVAPPSPPPPPPPPPQKVEEKQRSSFIRIFKPK